MAHRRGFSLRRRNWRSGRASRSLSTPLESTSSWVKCHRRAVSGLEDSEGAEEGPTTRAEEEDEEDAVDEDGGLDDGEGETEGGGFEVLVKREDTKTMRKAVLCLCL